MNQQPTTTFREGDHVLWRFSNYVPMAGVIDFQWQDDPRRYAVSIPWETSPTGDMWASAKEEELEPFVGPIQWPQKWEGEELPCIHRLDYLREEGK